MLGRADHPNQLFHTGLTRAREGYYRLCPDVVLSWAICPTSGLASMSHLQFEKVLTAVGRPCGVGQFIHRGIHGPQCADHRSPCLWKCASALKMFACKLASTGLFMMLMLPLTVIERSTSFNRPANALVACRSCTFAGN